MKGLNKITMREKQTKYYAVRVGRTPGVYTDIEEYRKQVVDYIGYVARSFTNEQEANDFVAGRLTETERREQEYRDMRAIESPLSEKEQMNWDLRFAASQTVAAYVDGSYDTDYNKCGFGVAITTGDGQEIFLYGVNKEAAKTGLRNVASEFCGAVAAIEWAIQRKVKKLIVVSDCASVIQANTDGTRSRNEFVRKCVKVCEDAKDNGLEIEFQKIAGHVGNPYGDMADALARYALGKDIKPEIRQRMNEIGPIRWGAPKLNKKKDAEEKPMRREDYRKIRTGYSLYRISNGGKKIVRGNVVNVYNGADKTSVTATFNGHFQTIRPSDFGKMIFLNKDNAEQMRKKMYG